MKDAAKMVNLLKVVDPVTPEEAMEVKAAFEEQIASHMWLQEEILFIAFKDGSFLAFSDNTSVNVDDFSDLAYTMLNLPKEYERKFAVLRDYTLDLLADLQSGVMVMEDKNADNH